MNSPTKCMTSVSEQPLTPVDMQALFGKWRLGKNITWLVVAIWKGRIEFSPLTEFAFNQEQSLRENILNSVATNVDPGEAMIWEKNPEDRDHLTDALNRQEGHVSLSLKAGIHFSVTFFPII